MPLAFPCLSHGNIAFGFFNIDTDLLLLEHYFFFADTFCGWILKFARESGQAFIEDKWKVHLIENRAEIGDLMGAIHGIRYMGFIGEVYTRFPFPKVESEFRQKSEGFRNRPVIEQIMRKYAIEKEILFRADPNLNTVRVGEYAFTPAAFQSLAEYVWLGGYPRWREGVRPGYVMAMKREIEETRCWALIGREQEHFSSNVLPS